MKAPTPGGRELKRIVASLLGSESFPASWESIRPLPGRQVINPLFACFCHRDLLLRWHAVTAMGIVVSRLADENMESARVVMRRFMWNLNEESGGIGWGCPEALGECMARNKRLAGEYGSGQTAAGWWRRCAPSLARCFVRPLNPPGLRPSNRR